MQVSGRLAIEEKPDDRPSIDRPAFLHGILRLGIRAAIVTGALTSFVTPRFVSLFFHLHRYPFTVGNKFLPVEFAAGNHREVPPNSGADLTRWIPELAEREPMSLGNPFEPVINTAHATLDFL